jgi:putative transposon-encoded protein
MKSMIKMEIRGYEALEKIAQAGGNSARIYVPKNWQGKKIKVVLLEP